MSETAKMLSALYYHRWLPFKVLCAVNYCYKYFIKYISSKKGPFLLTVKKMPYSFEFIYYYAFLIHLEFSVPLSSLALLVPPLRLMSAVMWEVVRQRNIKHYGKLEEFVSMVTDAVPELMSKREGRLLSLGLRARVSERHQAPSMRASF